MDALKAIAALAAGVFIVFVLHSCCPMAAQGRPAPKPIARIVRCQDRCPPCVDLVKELKRQGVTLRFEDAPSKVEPVPWFPAVEYSDGTVDWGTRVYEGKCAYPDVLPVIKHKQEG